ncbi:hypothetical protein D3C80_1206570 [compost metagenome]
MTPSGICSGNSCSRESIQRTLLGKLASNGTRARPTWPAPNTAICACTRPMGSNSNTVAPPQHWPRLAPRLNRSRWVSWRPLASISRAIFIALYSRCPPPMVSYKCSALTTIFEPALRGVEPRSSMMVTSTQGSPRSCRSASALIQLFMLHTSPVGAGLPAMGCVAAQKHRKAPPSIAGKPAPTSQIISVVTDSSATRCSATALRICSHPHNTRSGVAGASICGCMR